MQDRGHGHGNTPGVAPRWRAMREPAAQAGGGGAPPMKQRVREALE